ncbi:AAA family ATPase [Spirosoma litoris]
MKITGIEIGEYRQFKNIKFDFTYPKGHSKEGQPLDKVCFIGQSGTGKTTLLNVIWDLLQELNQVSRVSITLNKDYSLDNYMPDSIFGIKYLIDIKGALLLFNRNSEVEKSDKEFLDNWFTKKLTKSQQYDLIDTNKLCLFIKDSIAQDADAFLVDQEKAPQSFSDFIKTDTEIEQEIEKRKNRIKVAGLNRVVSLGERKSMDIWRYILKEIFEYDETGKSFARSIVHEADSSSINSVIDKLIHWKKHTTNPRTDLANACLNPLLKHFFLEIDTEGDKVPIVIKTNQGIHIENSYLSAGTRQLLATAIPIYKFDTTGTVILFDEPERSLFPDIQRILINYYTSLAPEAQFFFATHSPIIASAFEPCERFILYFNENGEVNFHNGVAPEGDDPNDILSEDFGMEELMLQPGLDAYERYRNLFVEIKNEKDPVRQKELIVEQARLGDQYKF